MTELVTVGFYGICTNFFRGAEIPMPVDWLHRVVLVNASNPSRLGHDLAGNVDAHVARLQIRKEHIAGELRASDWFPITYYNGEIVEWQLDGVSLRIAHEKPVGAEVEELPPCIPGLRAHTTQRPISEPGNIIVEQDPSRVSCFFDFFEQTALITGALTGGAAIALIDVASSKPGIVASRFGTTDMIAFDITPGATITVSNIPLDPNVEKAADFRLHYLTLKNFPDEFLPVHASPACPTLNPPNQPRHIAQITTPACSNSNYP